MPYPRLVNRNWTRSQLKPDIAQQKSLQTETLSIPGILDDMFGHFKACAISPFLRLLGGSKRENAWSAGSPAPGTFFHHPTRDLDPSLEVKSLNSPTTIIPKSENKGVTLPQELIDNIIDCLHGDVTALQACCLVRTSWVFSCRRQLYRTVAFHTLSDLEEWENTFPDVTQSPAMQVQSLSVAGLWASQWAYLGEDNFNPDEMEGCLLDQFRSFRQVRNLSLAAFNVQPLTSTQEYFSHFKPSMRSLELHSPCPANQTDLVNFICSFPRVNDLVITRANRWLDQSNDDSREDSQQLQRFPVFGGILRLLDFSDPSGEFINKLVDIPNGVSFRSIELGLDKLGELEPIGKLLSSCSSTLEVLTLGHVFAAAPDLTADLVNLESNHALRHLTLNIAASKLFSCAWIETLLSTISSAAPMDQISLAFTFGWHACIPAQLKLNDWQSLDAILTNVLEKGIAKKIDIAVLSGRDNPVREEAVGLVEMSLPKVKGMKGAVVVFGKATEAWPPAACALY